MKSRATNIAARYFFKNCTVSITLQGEMRISRNLTSGPGDRVLDRNFTPACIPSEFIGENSDFYRFLDATSSSTASLLKKLAAIGYMLCNRLPRGGDRYKAFLCVNEHEGACGNGKTLFSHAVAQFCDTVWTDGKNIGSPFFLSDVSDITQLLVVDDLPARPKLQRFYELCTADWLINRKCLSPLTIAKETVPYMLLSSETHTGALRRDGSFRRRFCILEFSSFFDIENRVDKYLGRNMFLDWDSDQWHRFDNLMFYCIREYLFAYTRGLDVFSYYE